MNRLLNPELSAFSQKTIAVWGDMILDEYVFTTTSRVSREAPVLITEFEKNEFRLGGAGNVVMNILTLGAKPIPLGFIGRDPESRHLVEILREHGICCDFLVELDEYRTPLKSRILSGGANTRKQQILRIDRLPQQKIPAKKCQIFEERLQDAVKMVNGLILSDYLGYSVRSEIWSRLQVPSSLPVMLDSRESLLAFKGVSVATPNEPEIRAAFPNMDFFSDETFLEAASLLCSHLHSQGIVLKRGAKGMIVLESGKEPVRIDIFGTDQIVDETGAGDTVLAVAGLSLAAGFSLEDAARLANIAAGIVVMKEGASPIEWEELRHASS